MMHRWIAVGALALASAVAGCGGGGGGGSTTPPTSSTAVNAGSGSGGSSSTSTQRAATQFTIKIPGPAEAGASSARKPAYISPSTQGVEIDMVTTPAGGGTPTNVPQLTAAIGPSSAGCTSPSPSGSYSCSVSAYLPVGTNPYVVALLDRAPTSGPPSPAPYFPSGTNVLSYAQASFTIANNTTNAIPLTLNGLIAGFAISPSIVTVPSGTATSIPVTVTAYDADSNIIIGPGGYDVPLVVSIADTSNSLTFSGGVTSVSLASPGPALTLNYNGGALVSGTISAAAHSLLAKASVVAVSANAVTVPLSTSGGAVTLVAVGGIRTYIAFPSNNAPAGTTITLGSQLTPPSGVSTLSFARRPQAVATPTATPTAVPLPTVPPAATALQYVVIAPNNSITFSGLPGFQFTGTFDPTQNYYVAEYDPTNPTAGFVTVEGPGVLSDGTLSFGGTTTSTTIAGGVETVFALLTIAGPTPTPTLGPTPVPTASVGIGIGIPGAPSQAVYVADSTALKILRFGANELGNVAPTWTLGPTSPYYGIAFSPTGTMVLSVAGSPGVIQLFNPVTGSTTGAYQTTPYATIGGGSTTLQVPFGINTDTVGNIYVTDVEEPYKILEFAGTASGNVAPIATIAGSNTTLSVPESIVLDQSNNIWVATTGGVVNGVLEFAPGANGNVAPIRTIAGSNTGLVAPLGVTLDYAGDIIVTDVAPGVTPPGLDARRAASKPPGKIASPSSSPVPGAVYIFAPGASGNVAPARVISGSATGLTWPASVASDGYGNIDVTSGGGPSVEVFAPGANGNAAPIKVISGSSTGLDFPFGIAISPTQP